MCCIAALLQVTKILSGEGLHWQSAKTLPWFLLIVDWTFPPNHGQLWCFFPAFDGGGALPRAPRKHDLFWIESCFRPMWRTNIFLISTVFRGMLLPIGSYTECIFLGFGWFGDVVGVSVLHGWTILEEESDLPIYANIAKYLWCKTNRTRFVYWLISSSFHRYLASLVPWHSIRRDNNM